MEQRYSDHWPEYLMEAGGLCLFMISACVFTTMLEHPGSPIRQRLGSAFLRRMIVGVGMGLTAIGLIYSPWGKQSGAHLNPSVTITFFRLGKLARADALFYVLAQFAGATAGVFASSFLLNRWISHPAVNYAVTAPGAAGTAIAFGAELLISFLLMMVILFVSNSKTLPAFTGVIGNLGRDLHHSGVSAIRHEHESGADRGIGGTFSHLESVVDLLHRTADRDARRGGALPQIARRAGNSLCQTAPPEQQTLHFPLRIS